MKKSLFLLLAMIMFSQFALGEVLITEVLYDPVNTENGGEAVLLYNTGTSSVDVSGWTLSTSASVSDATLPPNTQILPGGYLLIADSGFSLDKDESSWPDADHEENLILSNSDDGVALKDGNTVIDAVGWGDATNIDSSLYEGTPHTGTVEGESLRRTDSLDTNDNSVDFVAGKPVFFSSSSSSDDSSLELVVDLEVEVTDNKPEIKSVEILTDDNNSKEGSQINPIAGSEKTFEVEVVAYDADNSSEIVSGNLAVDGKSFSLVEVSSNNTYKVFRGNVSMNYYDLTGNYNITATIIDYDSSNVEKDVVFEYTALAAMEADTSLSFEVAPGNNSVESITLRNLGNQDIALKVKGSELVKGSDTITVDSVSYSTNGFVTEQNVSETYAETGEVLHPNSTTNIDLKIVTGAKTSKGIYTGQFFIGGTPV